MEDEARVLPGFEPTEQLFGRVAERDMVGAFLSGSVRASRVLLVVGEAGMGKTVLLAHAAEAAEAAGHRTLCARAAASEGDLPYTILADVLEPAMDAVAALPDPLRDALDAALLRRRADPDDRRHARAVAHGTLELIRALAQHGPVLVAVDNLGWVDTESREALTFAVRRLRREPIGVLATVKDVADAAGFDGLLGRSASDVLTLGPLEPEAFAAVVQAHTAPDLPASTIEHLRAATGGNPGAAVAIADEARRRGEPPLRPDRFPVPDALARPFATALSALPAQTRDLLLTAAAMSKPTLPELEAATGRPAAGAAGIDPAVTARLVDVVQGRVRFTHPLLPSVICDRATLLDRRAAHERLSHAVVDPDERVRHRAFATTGVDASLAAELCAAGNRAAARGAMMLAAHHLTLAVRHTPGGQRAAAVQRRLLAASYHRAAGNIRNARPLLERAAADAAAGEPRARALYALAGLRRDDGDLGAASALLDLAAQESAEVPALRSTIGQRVAGTLLTAGDARGARSAAARALADARDGASSAELAGARVLLASLDRITTGRSRPARVRRAAGMAGAADVGILARAGLELARCDMAAGRLHAARIGLEHVHRRLLLQGRDDELASLLGHLAVLEYRASRWSAAVVHAGEALAVARRCGQQILEPWLRHAEAYAQACLGQLAKARATAEAGMQLATEHGAARGAWLNRWVQGLIALSGGELHTAAQRLVPLQEASRDAGVVDVDETPWCTDAIEALIGLGECERAEAALTEHEDLLDRQDRPVAALIGDRCRGLLAAAQGDRAGALACLERSTKGLERLGYRFELARSLVALGVVQRRDRQPTAANASLHGALALFERTGTAAWAERTRAELRWTEPRGVGPLTPTESRIAGLAADGRTNREVAGLVHMSPKTVESHLTRIYRKLDIRSRAELGRVLDGRAPANEA